MKYQPTHQSSLALFQKSLAQKQLSQTGNHFRTYNRVRATDPGSSLKTAFKISPFTGRREFKNSVSITDRDFYRLQLSERRNMLVKANNLSSETLSICL